MTRKTILYFTPDSSVTKEQRERAEAMRKDGVNVHFRNAEHIKGDDYRPEPCDGVHSDDGMEIPAPYAKYPPAAKVIEVEKAKIAERRARVGDKPPESADRKPTDPVKPPTPPNTGAWKSN